MQEYLLPFLIISIIGLGIYIHYLQGQIEFNKAQRRMAENEAHAAKLHNRVREELECHSYYQPRGESKRCLRYRIVAEAFPNADYTKTLVKLDAIVSNWDLPDIPRRCDESQWIAVTQTSSPLDITLDNLQISISVRGWDMDYENRDIASEMIAEISDEDAEAELPKGFIRSNDHGFTVDVLRTSHGNDPVSITKINISLAPIIRARHLKAVEAQQEFSRMVRSEYDKEENKHLLMNFGPPPPDDFFSLT